MPKSSFLKRWELSFPGICGCLSKLESSPRLRMSFCPCFLPFIPFYHNLYLGRQGAHIQCSPLRPALISTVDVVCIFPLCGFSAIPNSHKPVPPDLHLSGAAERVFQSCSLKTTSPRLCFLLLPAVRPCFHSKVIAPSLPSKAWLEQPIPS